MGFRTKKAQKWAFTSMTLEISNMGRTTKKHIAHIKFHCVCFFLKIKSKALFLEKVLNSAISMPSSTIRLLQRRLKLITIVINKLFVLVKAPRKKNKKSSEFPEKMLCLYFFFRLQFYTAISSMYSITNFLTGIYLITYSEIIGNAWLCLKKETNLCAQQKLNILTSFSFSSQLCQFFPSQ